MNTRHVVATGFVLLAVAAASLHVAAQSTGYAVKRPVFGGACPACPWGAMADIVKDALEPHGWDVQVCYYCAGGPREARLVSSKAMATPPQNPTAATLPTPKGPIDFGATSVELLQYAYLGIHDFAKDPEGPRKQLRLVANIQTPNYFMVAVNVKSRIDDLRQIAERKMPIKLVARGSATEPINVAVLEHYGLSEEKIKAFGGTVAGGYTKGSDVDVIIAWEALTNAPEYA